MKQKKQTLRAGFTLVELLVVIAIIASLAALSTPQITKALKLAARNTATSNASSIKKIMDIFAMDFDGEYPNENTGELLETDGDPLTAAGCYQQLIENGSLDSTDEKLFYFKEYKVVDGGITNVNNDGELAPEEVCFGYTADLTNTSRGATPIIFDRPVVAGNLPEFDRRVWDGSVIVGRINGSVSAEKISGKKTDGNNTGEVKVQVDGTLQNVFTIGGEDINALK